jgi:hypothetical protein
VNGETRNATISFDFLDKGKGLCDAKEAHYDQPTNFINPKNDLSNRFSQLS